MRDVEKSAKYGERQVGVNASVYDSPETTIPPEVESALAGGKWSQPQVCLGNERTIGFELEKKVGNVVEWRMWCESSALGICWLALAIRPSDPLKPHARLVTNSREEGELRSIAIFEGPAVLDLWCRINEPGKEMSELSLPPRSPTNP